MKIVIIGGGLTGLSLTHWFHKQNFEVVLLESKEALGGRFRPAETLEIPFINPSQESQLSLEWLRGLSQVGFDLKEVEHQPLVFEGGEWRPFLGFGDFPSSVVNELSVYNQSTEWVIDPGLEQITRSMIDQLPVQARVLSEVVGFEIENGRVTHAVIGQQEKISGDFFIFTSSPILLNSLIEGEALKAASRTRIVKQHGWTSVALALRHAPFETSTAVRFVLGTGKEFQPVVGRVWNDRSVWMNLVPSEQEEDLEYIGDCVRFMKRTLKRVWPELNDSIVEERLRIRPHAFGKLELKLKNGNLSFSELPNLWLADPRMADVSGDLGTASMARRVSSLFVAEPQNPVLIDSEA